MLTRQFAEHCVRLYANKHSEGPDWWFNSLEVDIAVSYDDDVLLKASELTQKLPPEQLAPLLADSQKFFFSHEVDREGKRILTPLKDYFGETFHVGVLVALYSGMADRFREDTMRLETFVIRRMPIPRTETPSSPCCDNSWPRLMHSSPHLANCCCSETILRSLSRMR
jgi:hypothetical protein